MIREYVRVFAARNPAASNRQAVHPIWHLLSPNGQHLLCTTFSGGLGRDIAMVQAFDLFPIPFCVICKGRIPELTQT